MLQSIRKAGSSIFMKLFFLVLVFAFAALGVGSGFTDLLNNLGNANEAARVGDTKIGLLEFDNAFRRTLAQYQRQNSEFNPPPGTKKQIATQTLEQQVTDALVTQAAKDAGIRVSDVLVRQQIEKLPSFAGEDKQFVAARFQMLLQQQGMSEPQFVALIRQEVARRVLVEPIAGGAIAPKAMVEALYKYANEQRVGETVLIPAASVPGIPAPTDADLKTFHEKHAADYTLPEYRSFTVLALAPSLFTAEINPSEDDLKAAYEAHKSELVEVEKRKVEQVVVPDKATAEAVLKATQGGKSLADAAKANKADSVPLDFTAQDQFPEALRAPVFGAAKGAVVGPVESPLGFHIIRIDEIKEGHAVSLDEAKVKLAADLKREGAIDRLVGQVDKLGDKLMGGTPMEEVATGIGAVPVKVPAVDRDGTVQPGKTTGEVDKAAPDPAWIAVAFKQPQGETGPFVEGPDNTYFSVHVDSIVPPTLRPLAEVRDAVVTAWNAEQKAGAAKKQADALAAKVKGGAAMGAIATEAKAMLVTTSAVKRDPRSAGALDTSVSPAVVDALFAQAKIGDVTSIVTNDGAMVVRLTEIKPADVAAAGTAMEPLKEQLNRAIQEDQLAEFQASLRGRYKVKINNSVVDTVVGQ